MRAYRLLSAFCVFLIGVGTITVTASHAAATPVVSSFTPASGTVGTTGSLGIALSKRAGPPTSRVVVAGAGFGAFERVGVYFDSVALPLPRRLTTSSTGNFAVTISVPASARPGARSISARGLSSGRIAQARFTVRTDWPTSGYSNQHTGFNPYENVLNPGNVSGLGQYWSFPTGNDVSAAPVEANGVIYVGSVDHNLYALNATTGAELWSFTTSGAINASPAVANGVVYLGSADGNVYALNATTGAQLWRFPAGSAVYSAPTVANGVVYVGSGPGVGILYALNAATGTKLWSFTCGFIIDTSAAVANGVAYIGTDGGVYALNAATGGQLWSFSQGGYAVGGPVVANGVVDVSTYDGHLYALNAATGGVVWSVIIGSVYSNVYSNPAVANGVVYIGSTDHKLYALNAANGTQLWSFTAGWHVGSPVVANGVVYDGPGDGELYAVDASTGAKLWSFSITGTLGSLESSPVVANGMVYIGSDDNNLHAFDLTATSHFVWTATSSNTDGDSSIMSNGATNGSPGDLLFVTPNYDPAGRCGCVYEPAPIGVWYNTSTARWAVFREDGQAIPANEGYNVLVVPPNKIGGSVFVQRSTSTNTAGDYTLISNPLANGHPSAKLLITQNWNPGGTGGAYNPHNVGVWYDAAAGKWAIFNEDHASMPLGVSFNVMVGQAPSNGGTMTTLETTSTNRTGDTVYIGNGQTSGNPNNVTFATQNWNPDGTGGTYNNAQTGVWYDGAREGVFNENTSSPPLNAAFNILTFSSRPCSHQSPRARRTPAMHLDPTGARTSR